MGMITENQFWNIYAEYAQLETAMQEKIIAWSNKNPLSIPANMLEYNRQMEFVAKIEYLKGVFHKQYHYMIVLSGASGQIFSERKRMLDEIALLKKKVISQDKELKTIKKQCLPQQHI